MPEEIQKEYELVCILLPQLEGADLENVKKEIEQIITRLAPFSFYCRFYNCYSAN